MDRGGDQQAGRGHSESCEEGHTSSKRLRTSLKSIVADSSFSSALEELKGILLDKGITTEFDYPHLYFQRAHSSFELLLSGPGEEAPGRSTVAELPVDLLITNYSMVASMVMSRVGANARVFARSCVVKKVPVAEARAFMNNCHWLGYASCMTNLGAYHKGLLMAIASFSKGRKMRRLREDQRSYELIRFCTVPGITVTGGVSKLVRTFCRERKAAEVMTYVDLQFSEGNAFKKAGFTEAEKTRPLTFMVDGTTFKRKLFDERWFDPSIHYKVQNRGNLKMLLSCE